MEVTPRLLIASVVVVCAATPAGGDTGWQLVPGIEVGGGYYTNVALDTAPISKGLTSDVVSGHRVIHVAPQVTARVVRAGHVLLGGYVLTVRMPDEGENLIHHRLLGTYRSPGPWELGLGYEH